MRKRKRKRKRKIKPKQVVNRHIKPAKQQLSLTELPDDVLWVIFINLDSTLELFKLSHTCTRLQNLIEIYIPHLIMHPRFDNRDALNVARAKLMCNAYDWKRRLETANRGSSDLEFLKMVGRHSFISRCLSFFYDKFISGIEGIGKWEKSYLPFFFGVSLLELAKGLLIPTQLYDDDMPYLFFPMVLVAAAGLDFKISHFELVKEIVLMLANDGQRTFILPSLLMAIVPPVASWMGLNIVRHSSFQPKAVRLAKLSLFKDKVYADVPNYVAQYELENADPDYHVNLPNDMLSLELEHNKNVENILTSKSQQDLKKVKSTFFAGYFAVKKHVDKTERFRSTLIKRISMHPSL